MKGMIFLEFLTMVEKKFGMDMVDDLIDSTNPPSGGAYTNVGSYPMTELVAMVQELSVRLETPVPDLLKAYGHYLFARLVEGHPKIIQGTVDALDFMESIERHIHVEVRKLYPDAHPPKFNVNRIDKDTLEMHYISDRKLQDVAEGLMRGCLEYFKVEASIARESLENGIEKFTISRNPA